MKSLIHVTALTKVFVPQNTMYLLNLSNQQLVKIRKPIVFVNLIKFDLLVLNLAKFFESLVSMKC